jgi:hypothetical protein
MNFIQLVIHIIHIGHEKSHTCTGETCGIKAFSGIMINSPMLIFKVIFLKAGVEGC